MASFNEVQAQDRRLVILRLLHHDAGLTVNDRVLKVGLVHIGHNVSLDVVRADLAWLESVQAITVEVMKAQDTDIHIAKLALAGQEHIERARVIPGIKRPSAV